MFYEKNLVEREIMCIFARKFVVFPVYGEKSDVWYERRYV